MSTSTESAPSSAATDLTAAMERVQAAIGPGEMIPSEDVPDTGPLGPPRVVLQPRDLLAAGPTTRHEIADVIADVARRTLALGGDLEALAREIGANAAQILTVGDPVERFVAAARALRPAKYASVQVFERGALVTMHVDSDEDLRTIVADLGCTEPHRQMTSTSECLRAERGSWSDPVRVNVFGPFRDLPAPAQPVSTERAA